MFCGRGVVKENEIWFIPSRLYFGPNLELLNPKYCARIEGIKMSNQLPLAKYRPFFAVLGQYHQLPDLAMGQADDDNNTVVRQLPFPIWLEAQLMQESSGNPLAFHRDDEGHFSIGLGQIENSTYRDYHGSSSEYWFTKPENMKILERPLLNILWTFIIHLDNQDFLEARHLNTVENLLSMYNGGPSRIGSDQAYIDKVKEWIPKVLGDL